MSSNPSQPKAPLPKAFRRVWAAASVSSFGDGVYLTALPLLAASLTRDPLLLSVISAAALLPWLMFGLVGGALVDRWDRRRTMWLTDAARALLLFAAVAGAAAGWLSVPLLIALAFLLGMGQILFDTAAAAYVPEILDRDAALLKRANARLRGSVDVLDGFVGPPAGSFLFTLGRAVPLVVDAVSFVFSSLVIRLLPASPPRPRADRRPLLKEAAEGARYLLRSPLLLGLSLRPALGNFAFSAGTAVFVLFAQEELHLGATGFGLLLTCEAVGGFLGSLLSGRVSDRLGTGGALILTAVLLTIAQTSIGLGDSAVPVGLALAVRAAALSATIVLSGSVRQAIVPGELMGRVAAASRLLALGAAPLGALLGGWLATAHGLRAPYLVGAVFLGASTLISLTMTSNRKVEAALAEAERVRATERTERSGAVR
ncbi:MFS transporter [Streptomyces sp. NBC_00102]|uniref:MFS transporter n=1 Tax=Streptomyces sp. NBC_00102 TaxID=2975652 RepID=UPI00225B593F|nr:MFS transporter [Streptomyces sp. NBC_00102]MCX5400301.1 MFS transporter [Streptomyces sp. NBC_00102]